MSAAEVANGAIRAVKARLCALSVEAIGSAGALRGIEAECRLEHARTVDARARLAALEVTLGISGAIHASVLACGYAFS